MAITVLEEGFDSLSRWATTGAGVTRVRTGRTGYGLGIDSSAGTATFTIPGASESDTITVGFAWRISATGTARPFLSLRSDAAVTVHLTFQMTAAGAVEVRRGTTAGTVLGTSAATGLFTAGTWYYIECQAKLADTGGFVVVRVNGTQVLNVTGADTRNAGTKSTFDAIFLTTGSTNIQVFDDFYIVTGADGTFRGDRTYEGTGPFSVSHESFQTDLGAWVVAGATPTIVGGRHGNGLELSNSAESIALLIPSGQRSYFVVVGFALRVPTAPIGPTDFLLVKAGGTSLTLSLRLGTDGALSFGGVTGTVTPAGTITFGSTWYYVEASCLVSPTTGIPSAAEFEVRVDGVQKSYLRDSNAISASPGPPIDRVDLTGMSGAIALYDDLYVLAGTLADFEGDQAIGVLTPTEKVWNGSAYVDAPVRVYSGSAFVDAIGIKTWNGSTFVSSTSYSHAWPGATPAPSPSDFTSYEVGVCIQVTPGVNVYGLRIWNPGLATRASRSGKLWEHPGTAWSATPTKVREVTLPSLMAAGWSEHLFSTPYTAVSGKVLTISYDVGDGAHDDYGFVASALTATVTSADGKVTFPDNGGKYTTTPDTWPNDVFTFTYFGVDVLYA